MLLSSRQLSVLRRGRRPGPRVLRRDGGDQKRPEEVQVEEDPEESGPTGEGRLVCEALCVCVCRSASKGVFCSPGDREAGASLHPCGFSHDPLRGVRHG